MNNRKAKPWKTLSTRVLFKNQRIKIVEDTVRLPDGKVTTYTRYAPATHHGVGIIALNKKGQILLQREYSHPPGKTMWQLPGGAINPKETVEQAVQRELAEESGYMAGKVSIIGSYYVNNRRSDQKQFVAVCTKLKKIN